MALLGLNQLRNKLHNFLIPLLILTLILPQIQSLLQNTIKSLRVLILKQNLPMAESTLNSLFKAVYNIHLLRSRHKDKFYLNLLKHVQYLIK